ncbi:hypothetical protein RhiirB3_439842 [Rhizophagus irregularis]|nr:hypothetical protein RhiirB3_439842 [Rhizophagus irregularis]
MNIESFTKSAGWLNNFKKRHNIKQYNKYGEAQSGLSKEELIKKKEKLQELISNFDLEDVFNCDETGQMKNSKFTKYKYIQKSTTIPDSNNQLLDRYITPSPANDFSVCELESCLSSPPTTMNWIVTLDEFDSPIFEKQLLVQAGRGPAPLSIGFLPIVNLRLNADLILCTPKVSLQHSLILPTINEQIRCNTSEVTSLFTWSDIEDGVRLHFNRWDITPDFSPVDAIETPIIPTTIESSATAIFANSLLIPFTDSHYIFFTDGSLINLGTSDVSMGWS